MVSDVLHTTFVPGPGPNQITTVFSVTLVRLVRVLGRLQPQIDITNPPNALSNAMWDLSPLYTITK